MSYLAETEYLILFHKLSFFLTEHGIGTAEFDVVFRQSISHPKIWFSRT